MRFGAEWYHCDGTALLFLYLFGSDEKQDAEAVCSEARDSRSERLTGTFVQYASASLSRVDTVRRALNNILYNAVSWCMRMRVEIPQLWARVCWLYSSSSCLHVQLAEKRRYEELRSSPGNAGEAFFAIRQRLTAAFQRPCCSAAVGGQSDKSKRIVKSARQVSILTSEVMVDSDRRMDGHCPINVEGWFLLPVAAV